MTATTANNATFDANRPEVRAFLERFNNRWKMRYFFLSQLPSLLFWRVRVERVEPTVAEVSIPYGWRTQNPFRSTYFAAQAGAAELSTGSLALIALAGRGRISMLVTGMEAKYTKKATSRITFRCEEGNLIQDAVQRAIETGEGQTVTVTTRGHQETGELVSVMQFTWSFKKK